MSGRGQNPRNGRSDLPAGKPWNRDAYRAYTFKQRTNKSDTWADDEPYDPPETDQRRRDRNKQRMKAFQEKKKQNKPEQKPAPKPVVETAKTEDAPTDAPLYDTTPFMSGTPYNQEYTQNFDFGSFPPLCQETYNTLQGLNPRLNRDMPFPGFLHSMNSLLQTTIIDSVFDDGQRPVNGQDSRAQDILPPEYYVPGPIYEYLSIISTVLTPGNQEIKPNLPAIMVPEEEYDDEEGNLIPAGTFGPADADTHNVYEAQLCPYTTMRYVEESAAAGVIPPDNWNPLPQALMPAGGDPTRDFLGYLPIPALHNEGKESLRVGIFEAGDNIAGRIRYNAALFTKCNTELARLEDKFKMVKLGLDKGTRKYVKFKSDPGNLIFSEAIDPAAPLNSRMVRLMSNYSYGTNAAGSAGIHTLHRRRAEGAPGTCFSFNGVPDPGWIETRNALFEMQEHFAPVRGVDLPQIRDALNRTSLTEGVRSAAINGWIRKNYLK